MGVAAGYGRIAFVVGSGCLGLWSDGCQPVSLEGFLDAPRGGSAETLVDGECLLQVRGGLISAVFHASSRRDCRSHLNTCVIRRKTNRRHMIGDHHRRAAGTATLLFTALDGIFGTHNTGRCSRTRLPDARIHPRQ
jgi:hypothetical protein